MVVWGCCRLIVVGWGGVWGVVEDWLWGVVEDISRGKYTLSYVSGDKY